MQMQIHTQTHQCAIQVFSCLFLLYLLSQRAKDWFDVACCADYNILQRLLRYMEVQLGENFSEMRTSCSYVLFNSRQT